MSKKILITGALGQDGTILTKMLENEYELYGICRLTTQNEIIENHEKKYKIKLFQIDLSNYESVLNLVKNINPNCIVNFAGNTDVINPWDNIHQTFQNNCIVPLNLLESIINHDPSIFLFQSSSSLIYARSDNEIINENSNFSPMYPYGVSKLFSHNLLNEYRIKYGINVSSGIFFNHESFYRTPKFLSKKVAILIKEILNGQDKKLNLYDLNIFRDVSHAYDFMNGIKIIIDNNINDDFIFSSGKLTNMYDFVESFFRLHNLQMNKYVNYKEYGDKHEIHTIIGDNSKLKSIGWVPKYNTNDLIINMVKEEILNGQ
jgi:GDPmannose 4,6-dehydratase